MVRIFILTLCFFLNTITFANINASVYLQRIQQTCQCPHCDLQEINLRNFKPGSTNPAENPFVKSMSSSNNMPWLSCNFTGANLTGADLSNTNFVVSIRGYVTPLIKVNFNDANFTRANLSKGQFYGVDFTGANLHQANLTAAQLFLGNFQRASFKNSMLTNALSNVYAMHGWGSDFSKADFSGANLVKASLAGNFRGANFTGANLQDAKLVGTEPMAPIGPQNPWDGVNFSQADLKGASISTLNQPKPDFSKVIFCHTIMPNGETNNRDCH